MERHEYADKPDALWQHGSMLSRSNGIGAGSASMRFKINGLRMYFRADGLGHTSSADTFYSRRGDGPYYVWQFDKEPGQWRGSRVIAASFAPRELLAATWKSVPGALQSKLGEHYME
jgi:hypothetical protein